MQSIGNPNNRAAIFNGQLPPIGNPAVAGRIALARAMQQNPVQVGPQGPQAAPAQPSAPPLTPYNPQTIGALQAPQTGPVQHPLEALARALMPVAGNYQQGQNMVAERGQKEAQMRALSQAVAAARGGDPAGAMNTPNLSPEIAAILAGQAMQPPPKPSMGTVYGDDGVGRYGELQPGVRTTAPPATPKEDIPAGYQYGAPGTGYAPIPGGPADPATIAAQAAARDPFIMQQNFNPETNAMETIAVPRQQVTQAVDTAGGGQAVVGSRPVPRSQDERTAEGFANRLSASSQRLATLDQQGADGWANFLSAVPGGNYAQSPEFQQFDQARRDFINAQLRRESGATISPQEFDSANRQYFPVPGDSPQVIEVKRKAREEAVANMARAAGAGYRPPAAAEPAPVIAVNPQTGERLILQNGQWVPYNG